MNNGRENKDSWRDVTHEVQFRPLIEPSSQGTFIGFVLLYQGKFLARWGVVEETTSLIQTPVMEKAPPMLRYHFQYQANRRAPKTRVTFRESEPMVQVWIKGDFDLSPKLEVVS